MEGQFLKKELVLSISETYQTYSECFKAVDGNVLKYSYIPAKNNHKRYDDHIF